MMTGRSVSLDATKGNDNGPKMGTLASLTVDPTQTLRSTYNRMMATKQNDDSGEMPEINEWGERIVNGLRVPPDLNSPSAVNFILTQEPGRMKPKDLKAAIERNRQQREARIAEQQKLSAAAMLNTDSDFQKAKLSPTERILGTLAQKLHTPGALDLRILLAEEKLNNHYTRGTGRDSTELYRRQLRELAFQTDVDEVVKNETEKAFRISEDAIGCDLLSFEEEELVKKQRYRRRFDSQRTFWRSVGDRQKTVVYNSHDSLCRPGMDIPTAHQLVSGLSPSFDPNRSNLWRKRMLTLRRLISLVSLYLVRNRVTTRMERLIARFHANGAYTREEVRAFIEKETEEARLNGGNTNSEAPSATAAAALLALSDKSSALAKQDTTSSIESVERASTMAERFLAGKNAVELQRTSQGLVLQQAMVAIKHGEPEVSVAMARRALYPTFDRLSLTNDVSVLPSISSFLSIPLSFDDRSFFHVKERTEPMGLVYEASYPKMPIYFSPVQDKVLRTGAPEEDIACSAADVGLTIAQVVSLYTPTDEPKEFETMRQEVYNKREIEAKLKEEQVEKLRFQTDGVSTQGITQNLPPPPARGMPSWLHSNSNSVTFKRYELDMQTPVPTFRQYAAPIRHPENSLMAPFKPLPGSISYNPDKSLRTEWCNESGGFLSANYYLLGAAQSSWRDGIIPPVGPTLTVGPINYTPDMDRRASGLNCFRHDHLRSLYEWDRDVAPLQTRPAKGDILTDSESDDDDEFLQPSDISIADRIKTLFTAREAPASPRAKGKTPAKSAPPPKPASNTKTAPPASMPVEEQLYDAERKESQVELLRDRSILDLERLLRRERYAALDAITERALKVAEASTNPFLRLTVRQPFHTYEEDVYRQATQAVTFPELSNVFVESTPQTNPSASTLALSSTSAGSPDHFSK